MATQSTFGNMLNPTPVSGRVLKEKKPNLWAKIVKGDK